MPRNPNSPYDFGNGFPAIPEILPTPHALTNATENIKLQALATKVEKAVATALTKSTYQIWLDNGHEGSEEDFLHWLVGPPTAIIIDGKEYLHTGKSIDLTAAYAPYAINIDQEKQRSMAEDRRLDDAIRTTAKALREDCTLIYDSLEAEISNRLSADSDLKTRLNTESTRATQRENELEQAIETAVTNLVNTIVTRSAEEQAAREASIAQLTTTLETTKADMEKALNEETQARWTSYYDLSDKVNLAIADTREAIADLQTKLFDEAALARAREDELEQKLSNEIKDRSNADLMIQMSLNIEKAERQEADNSLNTALNTKASELAAALSNTALELSTAIAAEKADREDADIFYTDILTVNPLGGIKAGVDLNGKPIREVLTTLLYPYVAYVINSTSRTAAAATLENGATQTLSSASIKITKKSYAIQSVKLFNGATLLGEKTGSDVANGGTITFSNLDITVSKDNNPNLKFTVFDGETTSNHNIGASTFVYPYYWGKCTKNAAITEDLVKGLTKSIASKGNKTDISFTCAAERMVFAYPKAYGVLKSIIDPNNFEIINDFTRHEISVTGLDGTAQAYYVYVSSASTITGFKVDFKY